MSDKQRLGLGGEIVAAHLHAPSGARQLSVPGKHTLTALLPHDLAVSPFASRSEGSLEHLRKEISRLYANSDDSVFAYKLLGVSDMRSRLAQSDGESVGLKILQGAITIGAAAAAAALAVESGPVAAALYASGGALASELAGAVGDSQDPLDSDTFCTSYEIALRSHLKSARKVLLDRVHSVEDAREAKKDLERLLKHPSRIVDNQRNEMLDIWVNALNAKKQGGTARDARDQGFLGAGAGTLRLQGILLVPNKQNDQIKIDMSGLSAKLAGVPGKARKLLEHRRLDELAMVRAIEGNAELLNPVAGRGATPPPTYFAFGVLRDGSIVFHDKSEISAVARGELEALGGGSLKHGVTAVWNEMKKHTLAALQVEHVGG